MSSGPGDFRGDFTTALDPRDRAGRASGAISLVPDAVAAPVDTGDVQSLLLWAASKGHAVVPRGAGTGMPGGNVGGGISLDLTRHLTALDPIDPARRTIRVEAGVTAARVEAAAREQGLRLPALPSSAERCSIGGMLANNAAGARSFGHGAIREWVDSLEVVWADGSSSVVEKGRSLPGRLRSGLDDVAAQARSALPSWPSVRKNSSGYAWDAYLATDDPAQLLVGSEGTLGIVTARDSAERERLWALRHAASPVIKRQAECSGRVSTQFIEDCVVPPGRLTDYLTGLRQILERAAIDAVVFGHAGDANIHVNPLLEVDRADWKRQVRTVLEEVVALVADLGGTLAGEHGDGRLRAPFLKQVWGDRWCDIFRRTGTLFDPTDLLNPGVIVPCPGQDSLAGLTAERIR